MRTLTAESTKIPDAASKSGVVEIVLRDRDGSVRLVVLAPDRAAAFAARVMKAVNDARDPGGVAEGLYDGCPMCAGG